MIDFLEGQLVDKGVHSADDAYFVISVSGVGYKVLTSLPSLSQHQPSKADGSVKLYTSLIVREDAMQLVGFWQRDERQCFEMLIKASGVGIKSALSLMSALSVSDLTVAIMTGDHKQLTIAKGIGPKVAQRIALELKDKMQAWRKTMLEIDASGFGPEDSLQTNSGSMGGVLEEVETVLMSLGYTPHETFSALKQCQDTYGSPPTKPSSELLQFALKWLATHAILSS